MSTFSATLHQRVASPITPQHSPQPSTHSFHSTSSTRSYTPIHSLSLHDYRKLQASPSTPEPKDGKRLKRKTAATRLNPRERESLLPPQPPLRPSSPPSPPSTSHSESARRHPQQSVSSFRSLPTLQQRPTLGLRDIAKLNASSADLPRDVGLGTRKRLPRPKNIEIHRPLVASPIRSDPSSLDLLSITGPATTSTFTLSKFPFPPPPPSHPTGQENAPLNVWPPQSNLELTSSLLDTPPATPAVLHFRGTSFDVVNPHNSLYLSHLETPADLEEHNDYFHRTSLDSLLPSAMDTSDKADGAERPQRPLFDDLRSAHASIAKAKSRPMDHAEAFLSSVAVPPSAVQKPDRRTSIMDRARTVFKKKEMKQAIPEDEGLKAIPYGNTSTSYDTPVMGKPAIQEDLGLGVEGPSEETWEAYSSRQAANQAYDQASMYPESQYSSMSFGPINNRRSVPFGVRNQITDYSGEVTYEFSNTPRQSIETQSPPDDQIVQSLSNRIDNTLVDIYDHYNGDSTADDEDYDDDISTIKVPSLQSMVPASPREDRASGLSKFDFNLDDVRHSGSAESPVTSPVTPQDGAFPRITNVRTSPGAPPRSPPPFAPTGVAVTERRVSDELTNQASSYGDTRKLLGISGNVNSPNVNHMSIITEDSKTSSRPASWSTDDESVGGDAYPLPTNENAGHIEPPLRKRAMMASAGRQSGEIPAMWMRTASPGPGNLRNESPLTIATTEAGSDWETIGRAMSGEHSRDNSYGQALRRMPSVEDLTPKRTNTNPWRKDRTKAVGGDHAFTSPGETNNIPRFPRDSELSFVRNSRLPGKEQSGRSSVFQLSPEQLQNMLANGPSEDIVEEYEMSPLKGKSRANSFDKVAVMGPRANLTGTPMGTGMRDAGSSTVGQSSTPASNVAAYQEVFPSSSPVLSTPARESLLHRSTIYSPTGGMMNAGQFTSPRTPSNYVPSPLARGSVVSSQSSRVPTVGSYGRKIEELRSDSSVRAQRYRNLKAMSHVSSRTTVAGAHGPMTMPRASVRGMTSPFPLELGKRDSTPFGSERSEFINIIRPGSTHTVEPLTRSSPHLQHLPRPSSSNVAEQMQRKKRLSWIIVGLCAWFPPIALLIFLGSLDGLMFHFSKHEIYHIGQFQKNVSFGIFLAELLVLIIVLALWLAHVF